jgi:Replication factor RFC1 C terminal domain
MWSYTSLQLNNQNLSRRMFNVNKDWAMQHNFFQASKMLLDTSHNSDLKIIDRLSLFFLDCNMIPLQIYENYLDAWKGDQSLNCVAKMAEQADFMSLGDELNRDMFVNGNFGLLNNYGMMSTVAPCMLNPRGDINYCPFPVLMGQMSKMRKIFRMVKEIKAFIGANLQANRRAALIEYVPLIFWLIFRPLADYSGNKSDIEAVCETMRDLNLSLECFKEHILTLLMCGEDEDFNQLPVPTKTALTKAYNKLNSSSIKQVKKSNRDDEYRQFFDPDADGEPVADDSSEASADEDQEVVAVNANKAAKEVAPVARGRGRGRGGAPVGSGTRGGAGRGRGGG